MATTDCESMTRFEYYATIATKSMLYKAQNEVGRELGAKKIRKVMGGKLIFHSRREPERIVGLRSVERVGCLLLYRGAAAAGEEEGGEKNEEETCTLESIPELLGQLARIDFDKALKLVQTFREKTETGTGKEVATKFRVTCKRTGKVLKQHSSSEIAREAGKHLSALLSDKAWRVDLRDPKSLDIVIQLSDAGLLVGFDLAKQTDLGDGSMRVAGLDPVVSWGMIRSTELSPGDVLLDPMCGRGILLLEAFRMCPGATLVGFDMDEAMVKEAKTNFNSLNAKHMSHFQVMQSDSTKMPLRSGSVDVVACDLPFGHLFGSVKGNEELYPKILRECERTLKKDTGRAVLLTNIDNHDKIIKYLEDSPWCLVTQKSLRLGRMKCNIYLVCFPEALPLFDKTEEGNETAAAEGPEREESGKKNSFKWETGGRWNKQRRLERQGMKLTL